MKDLEMKITLYCSVCSNDQFASLDENVEDIQSAPEDTELRCTDCGNIATKAQIFEDNSHIIDANMEDLKKQAMKEIENEFKKLFK